MCNLKSGFWCYRPSPLPRQTCSFWLRYRLTNTLSVSARDGGDSSAACRLCAVDHHLERSLVALGRLQQRVCPHPWCWRGRPYNVISTERTSARQDVSTRRAHGPGLKVQTNELLSSPDPNASGTSSNGCRVTVSIAAHRGLYSRHPRTTMSHRVGMLAPIYPGGCCGVDWCAYSRYLR